MAVAADEETGGDQKKLQGKKAFEALGVCTQLAEACETLGWKAPTNIQKQAIPAALEGR